MLWWLGQYVTFRYRVTSSLGLGCTRYDRRSAPGIGRRKGTAIFCSGAMHTRLRAVAFDLPPVVGRRWSARESTDPCRYECLFYFLHRSQARVTLSLSLFRFRFLDTFGLPEPVGRGKCWLTESIKHIPNSSEDADGIGVVEPSGRIGLSGFLVMAGEERQSCCRGGRGREAGGGGGVARRRRTRQQGLPQGGTNAYPTERPLRGQALFRGCFSGDAFPNTDLVPEVGPISARSLWSVCSRTQYQTPFVPQYYNPPELPQA